MLSGNCSNFLSAKGEEQKKGLQRDKLSKKCGVQSGPWGPSSDAIYRISEFVGLVYRNSTSIRKCAQ